MAALRKKALTGVACLVASLLTDGCNDDVQWPLFGHQHPDRVLGVTFGPNLRADGLFEFSRGIDTPIYFGSPVHAVADGRVYSAIGSEDDSVGYQVTLCHAFTPDMNIAKDCSNAAYYTVYSYLSEVHVRVGYWVSIGNRVGLSGTGPSGSPHIHFEVRRGGPEPEYAIHPLLYLPYENNVGMEVSITDVDTSDPRHPVVTVRTRNDSRDQDLSMLLVRILDNKEAFGKEISRREIDLSEWNYERTKSGGDDELNTQEIDGIRFEPEEYEWDQLIREQKYVFLGLNGTDNPEDMRFEVTATDCKGVRVQAFYP